MYNTATVKVHNWYWADLDRTSIPKVLLKSRIGLNKFTKSIIPTNTDQRGTWSVLCRYKFIPKQSSHCLLRRHGKFLIHLTQVKVNGTKVLRDM